MPGDGRRELHVDDTPAAVAQLSAVRTLAPDVAGELHPRGVEAFLQHDVRSFVLFADGLELHVLPDSLAASRMDRAGGGADVRIREARDLLLEEIDETTLALEKSEKEKRGVG